VPLTRTQRAVLVTLRAVALAALLFLLCRPVLLLPPAAGDVVIPVLVDTSRSMRIADADGTARITQVRDLLASRVMPQLSRVGTIELLGTGDAPSGTSPDTLAADARRTDLAGAIGAVTDRFRGRRIGGIVVLSDGADTGHVALDPGGKAAVPVYAVGIGSAAGVPDREVVAMTAGDPRIDQALVDLHVTTVQNGFDRQPYLLRLLANNQVVETRRIVPVAAGTPSDETFVVLPDPLNPTVFTAEIVDDAAESITENNSRSVLLRPAARKRRVLVLAGAPGYEHSFLVRALSLDPGIEVDAVVRKGKDDAGKDTFLIQAGGGRGAKLTEGFPSTREALFVYDAVIIGNLEGDFFGRAQLELLADFVSTRGGGALLAGGRSFLQRGIVGSPLEVVLPLELDDRRGGAAVRAGDAEGAAPHHGVSLTGQGLAHPIMRLGATPDETRKRWAELPPLASIAPVGGPRPGATVLAMSASPNAGTVPLVAVQRYGRGRSMVFSGEASWRWRMLRPSTDRSYEFFWRQAVRWLASDASDPVALTVSENPAVGDAVSIQLEARDAAFAPVADAQVEATLTPPGGEPGPLALRPAGAGEHTASVVAETPGLYRVRAEARRGAVLLGAAEQWFQVGGNDPEFADPRLNEAFLRRLARRSGGQYVPAADIDRVLAAVTSAVPQNAEPERRDLWHSPWTFVLVIGLLAAEWGLRRLWGMR
jgi:uncharacterized membrane protein